MILIGGPNSNDAQDRRKIHHTIGEVDLYQASKCFEPIVAKTFVIRHLKGSLLLGCSVYLIIFVC
jgi:TPP-dependent 2-oxoacid decarboxylase